MKVDVSCSEGDYQDSISVTDDPNGDYLWWECPECQTKNLIPGNDPAERAVTAASEPLPGSEIAGIEVITDGDSGDSGEAENP